MCQETKEQAVDRLVNMVGEADRQQTHKQWDAARAGIRAAGLGGAMAADVARPTHPPYGAREVIRERIAQLQGEAERLSVLLHALPGIIPPAADEALCALVERSRR
jgi:hypothetical protein